MEKVAMTMTSSKLVNKMDNKKKLEKEYSEATSLSEKVKISTKIRKLEKEICNLDLAKY